MRRIARMLVLWQATTNINVIAAIPMLEGSSMASLQKTRVDADAAEAFFALKGYVESCVGGTCDASLKRKFSSITENYASGKSTADFAAKMNEARGKELASGSTFSYLWGDFISKNPSGKNKAFIEYVESKPKISQATPTVIVSDDKQLNAEAAKLTGRMKDAYFDTALGKWLQSKVADYRIELPGIARYIAEGMARGKLKQETITQQSLDNMLENDNDFRKFITRKISFAPEEFAKNLLGGKLDGIAALELRRSAVGSNDSNYRASKRDEMETARIRAVEATLGAIMKSSDKETAILRNSLQAVLGKTSKIDINGDLSEAERNSIAAVREFLIKQTINNPAYANALSKAGVTSIANDSQAGHFTQEHAIALGLFYAILKKGEKSADGEIKKLGIVAEPKAQKISIATSAASILAPAVSTGNSAFNSDSIAASVKSGKLVEAIANSAILIHSIGGPYTVKNGNLESEKERVKAIQKIFNAFSKDESFSLAFFDTPGAYSELSGGLQENGKFDMPTQKAVEAIQVYLNRKTKTDAKFGSALTEFNTFLSDNKVRLWINADYARELQAGFNLDPDKIQDEGMISIQTLGAIVIYNTLASGRQFKLPSASDIVKALPAVVAQPEPEQKNKPRITIPQASPQKEKAPEQKTQEPKKKVEDLKFKF